MFFWHKILFQISNSKRDGIWKLQSMTTRYSWLVDCLIVLLFSTSYFLLMNFCCPRYLLLIEWDVMSFWILKTIADFVYSVVERTIKSFRAWRWGNVVCCMLICSTYPILILILSSSYILQMNVLIKMWFLFWIQVSVIEDESSICLMDVSEE